MQALVEAQAHGERLEGAGDDAAFAVLVQPGAQPLEEAPRLQAVQVGAEHILRKR